MSSSWFPRLISGNPQCTLTPRHAYHPLLSKFNHNLANPPISHTLIPPISICTSDGITEEKTNKCVEVRAWQNNKKNPKNRLKQGMPQGAFPNGVEHAALQLCLTLPDKHPDHPVMIICTRIHLINARCVGSKGTYLSCPAKDGPKCHCFWTCVKTKKKDVPETLTTESPNS